jgi:ureidoglycolate lyase
MRQEVMMLIKAKPLNPELFAPFGQVLMGSGEIPERIPFAAKVENYRSNANLNITYLHVNSVELPLKIEALERHFYSNQIFVPLNGTRHLIVVCPKTKDDEPNLLKLEAFTAESYQAVNYYAGTWHAPRTSIGGSGEFIMMRWDDATNEDEEFFALSDKIKIAS